MPTLLRLPSLFLVCALSLGLVLVRLVPVGEVPDETAHIVRAYALSAGQWIGHRVLPPGQAVPEAGYDVDTGLFAASFASDEAGAVVDAALAARRDAIGWSGVTTFTAVPNTASYAPPFYLLSATALGTGRLLGLSPSLSIAGARAANLAGFALLGALALGLARRARYLLFALLCLPSSLSLAASANQDGLLIAVVALGVALLTRPEPAARRWAALALGAACLAKPPYAPLLALLVVPASGWSWSGAARGAGLAVLAAMPAVLWSLAALHWTVVPFFMGPYTPGPLYTGAATTLSHTDGAAQLAILRAHPALAWSILLDTASVQAHNWRNEVVGVLGRLSLGLPSWLYHLWFAALACAVAGDMLARRTLPASVPSLPRLALVAAAALGTVLLVFTLQFMTWTLVGEPLIRGVQGRYFVPVLLALALALPAPGLLRGWPARVLALPVLGASALQLATIPLLVVRRWYLH